ncbi:hypothetical protein WKH14_19810 [Pantoea agglomerans]|uniref:hypothetical protein n=1 Tax=Enterobacter agglomerans TaxID=549 RepID=UPI003C7CD96E
MLQNFLLTYSVKAVTDYSGDVEKASKVRAGIADIEIWEKASDVETTFIGKMEVSGMADNAKKENAIKQVRNEFMPILEKHKAHAEDVVIHCVMMLKNIELPFHFTIKW